MNNHFAMEYDWNNQFDQINGHTLYQRDADFDYNMKPQMTRSTSANSGYVAPGLMPSTDSTRSASSSTVGSPYSGHMQMVSQQESFSTNAYAMHGLGVTPAIVGQDGFQQEYNHMSENDMLGWSSFPDSQKMNGIGRFADLSSYQHRSSTIRLPISQPSTSSPIASLSSAGTSPDQLTLDTVLECTAHATARISLSPHEPVFKSPSTPASAYPKTPAVSHSPEDRRPPKRAKQQPHPHVQHAPMASPAGNFQTHFFAQSSGSFMPPIETSCWFSLLQFCSRLSCILAITAHIARPLKDLMLTSIAYRSHSDQLSLISRPSHVRPPERLQPYLANCLASNLSQSHGL